MACIMKSLTFAYAGKILKFCFHYFGYNWILNTCIGLFIWHQTFKLWTLGHKVVEKNCFTSGKWSFKNNTKLHAEEDEKHIFFSHKQHIGIDNEHIFLSNQIAQIVFDYEFIF